MQALSADLGKVNKDIDLLQQIGGEWVIFSGGKMIGQATKYTTVQKDQSVIITVPRKEVKGFVMLGEIRSFTVLQNILMDTSQERMINMFINPLYLLGSVGD